MKKLALTLLFTLVISFAFGGLRKTQAFIPNNYADPGSIVYTGTLYSGGKYYSKSKTVSGYYYIRNTTTAFTNCILQFNYKNAANGDVNWHLVFGTHTASGSSDIKCSFTENMTEFYAAGATHSIATGCAFSASSTCLYEPEANLGEIVVDSSAPTTQVITGTIYLEPNPYIKVLSSYAENYASLSGGTVQYYWRRNGGSWSLAGSANPNQQFIKNVTQSGTYDFYSIGTDAVGNKEAKSARVEKSITYTAPTTPTPITTATKAPTTTKIVTTPKTSTTPTVTVSITGSTSPEVTGDLAPTESILVSSPTPTATEEKKESNVVLLVVLENFALIVIAVAGFYGFKHLKGTKPVEQKTTLLPGPPANVKKTEKA